MEPIDVALAAICDSHRPASAHKSVVRIASFNGGGSRGIIPARISQSIEEYTGAPLSSLFDLFAGTSTGGIIATALTIPEAAGSFKPAYTAKSIVQLFETEAAIMFPSVGSYASLVNFLCPKYSSDNFRKVLGPYCKDFHLSDCIKPVLMPAAELDKNEAWWFSQEGVFSTGGSVKISKAELDAIPLLDILEGCCSAPTIFPQKHLPCGEKVYRLIDGGTFANNPSCHALLYANSHFKSKKSALLSNFGTGACTFSTPASSWLGSGLCFWGANLAPAMISLAADDALTNLSLSFSSAKDLLLLNPEIDIADFTIADAVPQHMEKLRLAAEEYVEKNDEEIKMFCHRLEEESDTNAGT